MQYLWKCFLRNYKDLQRGRNCQFCQKGTKKTTSEFVWRARQIHCNDYDYSLVNYKNAKTKVKIKCNNCGNIFEQIPDSHLAGSGCSKCNIKLKGEKAIRNFLIKNKIPFVRSKIFPDLKDKRFLSYDFFLEKNNISIEFNGIQHYKFIDFFHKNLKNFHKQKHHDWLKRKYARDNKINLITISYLDDIEEKLKI